MKYEDMSIDELDDLLVQLKLEEASIRQQRIDIATVRNNKADIENINRALASVGLSDQVIIPATADLRAEMRTPNGR